MKDGNGAGEESFEGVLGEVPEDLKLRDEEAIIEIKEKGGKPLHSDADKIVSLTVGGHLEIRGTNPGDFSVNIEVGHDEGGIYMVVSNNDGNPIIIVGKGRKTIINYS